MPSSSSWQGNERERIVRAGGIDVPQAPKPEFGHGISLTLCSATAEVGPVLVLPTRQQALILHRILYFRDATFDAMFDQ
jgi:hypothetical protein